MLIASFVFYSCNQRQAPPRNNPPIQVEGKTFEEQAMELLEKIDKETKIENKLKQEENKFSEGVQEVLEWYDYQYPIVKLYSNPTFINSNSSYNQLLKEDPLSVKALKLNNVPNDDPIKIKDISIFKNLEYLELNSFDSLPTGFYDLTKLKVFMSSNRMRCKMTNEISKLKNLQFIKSLFANLELNEEINKLKKLETIVMYNFSTNQPYKSLYEIPSLKTLSIRYSDESQLTGISKLRNLKTFITNKVSPEVGDLNLTGLIVNENQDEGYPENLGNLKNLVAFYWQGNSTMDTAPKFVQNLQNLEYLEIRGCSNFKYIPSEYDNLGNLKQFDIVSGPRFDGEINHLEKIKEKINIK